MPSSPSLSAQLLPFFTTTPPQAVLELQRRCPAARILYVSATGATEAENLCYMERLGLWGPGTPFKGRKEFVGLLTNKGVGEWDV